MILSDIHASLLRFCADFAEANTNMAVINFDAHADETTIPNADVVGMSGMSLTVDEHVVGVKCLFGLSTLDDTNLFRMVSLMDALLGKLLPTKTIQIYNATTGALNGLLVVENGTTMLAVGGSVARPLQYIMVSMSATRTVTL